MFLSQSHIQIILKKTFYLLEGRKHHFLLLLFAFSIISCKESITKKEIKSPDELYNDLFATVQLAHIYPNSKTFADAIPKFEIAAIQQKYEEEKIKPNFNLKQFVETYFYIPTNSVNYTSKPTVAIVQHINNVWDLLKREPKEDGGSLIPLRKPYLISGGQFNELHYWDSYFTMLGLEVAGKENLIENMVLDFAQLIQDFGHIPSGNRSYYLSRSQPPFFPLMVELLATTKNDNEILINSLPQMQKEYQYWMSAENAENTKLTNEKQKKGEKAYKKVVFIEPNQLLNRYFDETETPRAEAYSEDVALAKKSNRNIKEVYRHIRAAAESGWNFSSRWLKDGETLESIYTADIVPIDLNALLYNYEMTLAKAYQLKEQTDYAATMQALANKRKAIYNKYCWNEEAGFYFDYDFVEKKQTPIYSLAACYPLFFKMATAEQAQKVAKTLEERFLQTGGLSTTLSQSKQHWDSPNGYSPLHWIAIQGLRNYGFKDLANKIKSNWVNNLLNSYKNTGKLVDRYPVIDTSIKSDNHLQDGYGWTNGVLLKLLSEK